MSGAVEGGYPPTTPIDRGRHRASGGRLGSTEMCLRSFYKTGAFSRFSSRDVGPSSKE